MRSFAIVALLLVSLLAALPVSAAPAQPACNGVWATEKSVGPATLFASPPCYRIDVDAMSCPLAGSWKEVARAGTVVVRAYTCDSPQPTAADQPCTCPPPECHSIVTEGLLSYVASITVTRQCHVVIAVLPGAVECADPLDGAKAVTVSRLTVVVPCGDVQPCEIECAPPASAVSLAACTERVHDPAYGLTVYVFRDCSVRADYKAYDCVWNCGWTTVLQGPPVTVRVWQQQNDASAMAADPFPTCIRDCSPLPDGCDARRATPAKLQPLVWGNDCTVDVEPVYACAPPSGFTVEREVAFVHVTLLVCDGGITDRVRDLLGPAWS